MKNLVDIITSADPALRDLSLETAGQGATLTEWLEQCRRLDAFRRDCPNLYERVRALFFLYAIHRFHLPRQAGLPATGHLPFEGYIHLRDRRFEEAVDLFLQAQAEQGPSDALASALAEAYHRLGFQTLVNQVRRSVKSVRGNQWMFRTGHPADQPLRIRPELKTRSAPQAPYPILREVTPVRMDLSHSAWSDIFFLGMDYPEGARVLNVSIDLGVRGRDAAPRPPIEVYLRVIAEPVLRLVSVDLGAQADVTSLAEVFDFARDYLGLLKAAVIAAGIVPPGLEGSGQALADLLARLVGPGLGLELVSCVNGIPKGSRLAVSTNLLAGLISACMRATGQTAALTGSLSENERRLVAARAILGEWLAGSGGGWQDSGGLWPGMKLICGVPAAAGDPEFGISRGRLLPQHRLLDDREASPATRARLQQSLVLVHGGMAQNVGPILEMVTEKYLLRSGPEWRGRQEALRVLDRILAALQQGDIREIGATTTYNFEGPLQAIIPWASTCYTETLIARVRAKFGDQFWGFWMLGGMSGGGMGFIFDPARQRDGQDFLGEVMRATKRELEHALPFAMEPVVYDFAINTQGTSAGLLAGDDALLPTGYYARMVPRWLRADPLALPATTRSELDRLGAACHVRPELRGMMETLFEQLLPRTRTENQGGQTLAALLEQCGFDAAMHEQIRTDVRSGRLGLAQNRLPASTTLEDVRPEDVVDATAGLDDACRLAGQAALAGGAVAVVSLAAGVGSRWTQGAGVVKALHPFCKLGGRHRSFIEVHIAKSRRAGRAAGRPLPHLITTSYLTHEPIRAQLALRRNYGYEGPLLLSPGRAIGLRMIPAERDLRFAWEELIEQRLDEQAQKVRDSLHAALIGWARQAGEGNDYTDNLPFQCLHPVGHWFEVPNLLRNGVLAGLLAEQPQLQHLFLHNIDTTGADVDPALLGQHIRSGACLTFEVIARRLEDRGGGLARVGGRARLVEGLALPREEAEFTLSYYNTQSTWINIARLLAVFGLTRADLGDAVRVTTAIRELAGRIPTYITLKEVKKRWGHGQEDVYPVSQFEKLWSDMSALPEVDCRFVVVPRLRGQQLKDQAQLDGWLRDGSAAYVEALCAWE
ncbi:MAG: UTP--glucose-1-phosphate uridylyltransferase [Kiritimatiellaeota bacterium]|nr:UTP--glucose-1-phosphate uridylyltransferase [Kiritimatiellota bacterium]